MSKTDIVLKVSTCLTASCFYTPSPLRLLVDYKRFVIDHTIERIDSFTAPNGASSFATTPA